MDKLDLESFNSSDKNLIKHEGVISKISKNGIIISLKGNINCEGCKAQSACGVSDSNDKEIEIPTTNIAYALNETVNLVLEKQLGLKAVFWAYVFPFILMMITLIIFSAFFEEWIAGLVSLFVLVPYYFMLYMLNDSFKRAFKISIFKLN